LDEIFQLTSENGKMAVKKMDDSAENTEDKNYKKQLIIDAEFPQELVNSVMELFLNS
jgi:hypothetical protein